MSKNEIDKKFLEDQFYLGVTYNIVTEMPNNVSQRNLSYGLQGGIIKDIPLSYNRNFGIGIGVGYAINSYYTNLFVSQQADDFEYTILDEDTTFKRNKIATHALEVPFQIRWRDATPEEFKFWRVYAGLKMGYVFDGRSKYVSETATYNFQNKDIRNFQYGLTLDVGYNTFNIHVYYALNALFKDEIVAQFGDSITFKPLRVGLIFYIL